MRLDLCFTKLNSPNPKCTQMNECYYALTDQEARLEMQRGEALVEWPSSEGGDLNEGLVLG